MRGTGFQKENLRGMRRFFVFLGMAVGALGAEGREVALTILCTTDMHGSIRATPGTYAEHNEGSLLRCATIAREARAEAKNVLLVDCGDAFQGTAESYLTRGGTMAKAMNALGYDAFAVGNHEFDWGVPALGEILGKMEAPPLAANLFCDERAPEGLRRVRPYVVKEVDGIRVGIAGLTTPNLPNWFRDLEANGVRAVDSRRGLEQALPALRREKPDVMVLLVHQGLTARDDEANQVNAIARRFGEFDVVLGGHLHWVLAGARVGKIDYAQAGSGARGVLRIDLTYDTVEGKVTRKKFEYVEAGEWVSEDAELAGLVADDLARADEWLGTKLGRTEKKIGYSLAGAGESPMQQLLCEAIAEATGAEVVLHGVLSDQGFEEGDVRVADVWRVVPYENTIGCAWLNAGEIREIMEESAEYLGTDRHFAAWGLRYELHAYAPAGRRIRQMRMADGSAVHPKKRLKTAINSYHLAGGGGRFPALARAAGSPNARLEFSGKTTREMVMEYVKGKGTLEVGAGTNAAVYRRAP